MKDARLAASSKKMKHTEGLRREGEEERTKAGLSPVRVDEYAETKQDCDLQALICFINLHGLFWNLLCGLLNTIDALEMGIRRGTVVVMSIVHPPWPTYLK